MRERVVDAAGFRGAPLPPGSRPVHMTGRKCRRIPNSFIQQSPDLTHPRTPKPCARTADGFNQYKSR
jgi:hypothetical protein